MTSAKSLESIPVLPRSLAFGAYWSLAFLKLDLLPTQITHALKECISILVHLFLH